MLLSISSFTRRRGSINCITAERGGRGHDIHGSISFSFRSSTLLSKYSAMYHGVCLGLPPRKSAFPRRKAENQVTPVEAKTLRWKARFPNLTTCDFSPKRRLSMSSSPVRSTPRSASCPDPDPAFDVIVDLSPDCDPDLLFSRMLALLSCCPWSRPCHDTFCTSAKSSGPGENV